VNGVYKSGRTTVAIILIFAVLCGFVYELYDIQITNNEYYAAQNNTVKTYTVPIEAARGEIVDRNGNPLVTNRQGNSIILDAAYFPSSKQNDERNEIILNLIKLFNKNNEEFVHNLPLKVSSSGKIKFFTEDDDDNYEADIATMKSADMLNLQSYATAQNCFDAMVEKYGLESYLEKYDIETVLEIGNIRYELTRLLFSVSNPITIADDVSDVTVATIKENGDKYLGADVSVVAYREYTDSTLAPHIIGTIRKINAEEYEELKDEGYSITDEIGESGIESACEENLRGTPGEKTVTIDGDGNVTEEITKQPVQGDTVVLTIDKDLQALAQEKLEEICKSVDSKSTGAVVVEDCNNGEVLAAASYPSYDLDDYYSKYNQLASNSSAPLYNRFALGTYAPGSTFKPMMSAAALEEGVISQSTTFNCSAAFGVNGMTFKCTDAHGSETVRTALRDSCNVFFYNCAQRLGIDKMNLYGSMFGLGEKTGVEIPEASGILAGPEYRKKYDMTWAPGDTVQAGIGQSDNLFTPLQLANYCATIANGGTRYQLHFVKSRISNATGIVTETGTNVVQTVDVSSDNLKIVREGMRLVATSGGPRYVFAQIDTNVACKTGTSQVVVNGVKHNNGFLITFAPYENPEISVASAIELAGSGTSTAEITSSIIDYYYSHNTNEKKAQQDSTLLN
jgi:penicillin-binding protein 2